MIWRVASSRESPMPSTPALLETTVRPFTPDSRIASDKVKYRVAPGNFEDVARAASIAERFAKYASAKEKHLQAAQGLADTQMSAAKSDKNKES